MDGLLVYRQYLENIRGSIKNFKLPELQSKEFMGILHRVNQIEDLSYIDVILKNAGLNLSFIGDRSFLDKKVVLKSKLGSYFEETVDMDAAMKNALSDYMSIFMSEEDEIIKDIEEFSGENGVPEISLDYFPKSSVRYYSAKEVVERNKDTLSALFGALEEMDRKLEKSEEIDRKRVEEMGIVEEFFDEETSDEELVLEDKDIKELITEEIEEKRPSIDSSKLDKKPIIKVEYLEKPFVEENNSFENEEIDEDIEDNFDSFDVVGIGNNDIEEEVDEFEEEYQVTKVTSTIDTSFLLDDEPEDDSEDVEVIPKEKVGRFESDLDSDFELDYKDEDTEEDFNEEFEDRFSINEPIYRKEEKIEDYPDIEDDFQERVSKKNFNQFFDDNDMEDTTGYELEEDLKDEDELLLRDTDPREQNAFEEATNYFLTGKSQSYSDDSLKKLYKSKEKIVKAEGVNDTDDGLAKMVLALSDGLMNLPHLTGGLFRKAKKNGKKMRETMIVEGDEDDDF